jgi:hypothetical protein
MPKENLDLAEAEQGEMTASVTAVSFNKMLYLRVGFSDKVVSSN